MINTLAQSRYSAFISYAHADDVACFGWITHFRKELERGLAATLRGLTLPPVHQSGDNGPISGVLQPELRERVEQSFAMIIVVHDNYVQSEWCRKELEYFVERFGAEGCAERLYILALSEPAVKQVAASDAWQRLLPSHVVWMSFSEPDRPTQPVEIYLGPQLVSPQFKPLFVRLRDEFAGKLKAAGGQTSLPIVAGGAAPVAAPTPAPVAPVSQPVTQPLMQPVIQSVMQPVIQSVMQPVMQPLMQPLTGGGVAVPAPPPPTAAPLGQGVRIYIESNRNEVSLWQRLGEQMQRRWEQLAAGQPQAPALSLRARGLPVDQIDGHPRLDDADGVVLLWGRKTPDALVAQINKVENKMSAGRDAAPGIVAYLMPPQQSAEPVPAWGWPVLRFDAEPQSGIDVVAEDDPELNEFLRRVLERRLLLAGQPGAAVISASMPAPAPVPVSLGGAAGGGS